MAKDLLIRTAYDARKVGAAHSGSPLLNPINPQQAAVGVVNNFITNNYGHPLDYMFLSRTNVIETESPIVWDTKVGSRGTSIVWPTLGDSSEITLNGPGLFLVTAHVIIKAYNTPGDVFNVGFDFASGSGGYPATWWGFEFTDLWNHEDMRSCQEFIPVVTVLKLWLSNMTFGGTYTADAFLKIVKLSD